MKNILLKTRLFYKYQLGIMLCLIGISMYFNSFTLSFYFTNISLLLFFYRELYSSYFVLPEKCEWQKSVALTGIFVVILNIISGDYNKHLPITIFVLYFIIYNLIKK